MTPISWLCVMCLIVLVEQSTAGYRNNFDGYLNYALPNNYVLKRLRSYHHNHYEDRRWDPRGTRTTPWTYKAGLSGYVNGWDSGFSYACPHHYSIYYLNSYHSNNREDRRWRYGCARHTYRYGTQASCGWTGYINGWDAAMDYTSPHGYTMRGLGSYHSNNREDRRWRVYQCKVVCNSNYYRYYTQCRSCATGYYKTGETSQRSCQAGYYCPGSCRRYGCQSGKFSTGRATACTNWSTCYPGKYQSTSPSSTRNRGCSNCASGTYSSVNNAAACSSWRKCNAGYYTSRSPTASSDRVCSKCTSGKYQPASSYTGSTCTKWRLCGAGYYVNKAGTTSSDRTCSTCPRDAYQDATSHAYTSCKAHTTCNKGHYASRVPSSTYDRLCSVCEKGKYQPDNGFTGTDCTTWKTCGKGEFASTQPTSTSNRICSACPAETYQDSSSHVYTSCKAYNTCSAGKYTSVPPTPTSARICVGCSTGTYQASSSFTGTSCTACSTSTYQDATGEPACKTCSTGHYRYSASKQAQCEAGYRCPGSCTRLACDAGSYQDQAGQTSCISCPNNQFQASTGQTSCQSCSSGHFRSSSSSESICTKGSYCPGNCEQRECPLGTHQDATGGISCKDCDSTQYQDEKGQHSCKACDTGHYRLSSFAQAICPAGSACPGSCAITACTAGVDFSAIEGVTACTPVLRCGTGEKATRSPSPSSNTVCEPCDAGMYQTLTSHLATACLVPRDCTAGLRILTDVKATADRTCTECDGVSRYQDETNKLSCKNVTTCTPQQEYEQIGPSATSDRVCVPYTECGVFQYDIVKATPTSDRTCINVTEALTYSGLPRLNSTFTGLLPWARDRLLAETTTTPATTTMSATTADSSDTSNTTSVANSTTAIADNSMKTSPAPSTSATSEPVRRRRALDPIYEAELQTAWEELVQAAHDQLDVTLASLGLNQTAAAPLVQITLVTADGTALSITDANILDGAVRVRILFTSQAAWSTFMSGVTWGVANASDPATDWPLVLAPCLPEAFLGGALTVAGDGNVTVECVPRSTCVLGETFASWHGNRTTDRVCSVVSSCANGEAQAPTLRSDRVCASASTLAASTVGALGGAAALVLLALVLVVVVVARRRSTQRKRPVDAMLYGDDRYSSEIQTSFVNPNFSPFVDSGGAEGGRKGMENPLYDTGSGPVSVQNPMYDADMMEDEALYDEVAASDIIIPHGDAFEDENGGYLDVSPEDAEDE